MIKNFFKVSSLTLLSRILGFVRDVMFASFIGATYIADAFFVAFRFPNLFRSIFAEGMMNAVFVPMYSKIKSKGKEVAQEFINKIFTLMFIWVVIFVVFVVYFMREIMAIQAIGFLDDFNKFNHTVMFAKIMFPYIGFMVMNSLFGAILNSNNIFTIPAFLFSILNIVFIAIFGMAYVGIIQITGYELCIGVVIAGFLQFFILFFTLKKIDINIKFVSINISQDVKDFFKKSVPIVIGALVLQLNIIIGTIIASTLETGSISFLYYADRLAQFPMGIIGVAMGIVLLPELSKSVNSGDVDKIHNSQMKAITFSSFFTIPCAVAFGVISFYIVNALFGYGEFTKGNNISNTATCLVAMSFGVPAYIYVKILSQIFFANGDTKTTVQCGILSMAINLILALILKDHFSYVGIAIASTISGWCYAFLLFYILKIKKFLYFDKNSIVLIFKIIFSAFVMGVLLYFISNNVNLIFVNGFSKIIILLLLVIFGFMVYIFMCVLLKTFKLREILKVIKR